MADFRPLVIDAGQRKRLATTDRAEVGTGIISSGSSALDLAAGSGSVTISGSTAMDLSGSSGTFQTPTGAATFNGSSNTFSNVINADGGVERSSAGTLAIGTGANTTQVDIGTNATNTTINIGTGQGTGDNVNIGGVDSLTTVKGDFQVDGAETIVGGSTFQQDATFNGNVTFGDAAADTISFVGRIATDLIFNDGAARSVLIDPAVDDTAGDSLSVTAGPGGDASATGGGGGGSATFASGAGGDGTAALAAGAGGNVSVVAGDAGSDNGGGGANGGDVVIKAGNASGAGTDGTVTIGATTTSAVNIGAAAITTTVAGPLNQTTGQVTFGGNVDMSAGADVTGLLSVIDSGGAAGAVELHEGTAPAATADAGWIYTKDVGGITELHYREDSVAGGTEVQITSNGGLNIGSITGTANISWETNNDGAAGSDEDPFLILKGGDGAELITSHLLQDSSADELYLYTKLSSVGTGVSDRSSSLTVGPQTAFNDSGDDADATLVLRGHQNGDAVGSFTEGSITVDASADDMVLTGPTGGAISAATNLDAEAGLDVTTAALTVTSVDVELTSADISWQDTDGSTHNIESVQSAADTLGSPVRVIAGQGGPTPTVLNNNDGGNLDLLGGQGGPGTGAIRSGTGGDVNIRAGNTGTSGGAGTTSAGDVNIDSGNTASTAGDINIGVTACTDIFVGNATNNTTITQAGSGQVTFTGNVDMSSGADVTGGSLTVDAIPIDKGTNDTLYVGAAAAGFPGIANMTNAQRNALTPNPGALVWNTDSTALQVWDGASWTNTAGSLTGTDNISWTINEDATAASNEDPILYLLGGDGVVAPNDDLVRTAMIQDSSAEFVELYMQRDRNSTGYVDIATNFQVGRNGMVADLDAVLQFNSGTGVSSRAATITLDGTNDDLIVGTGATSVSTPVNLDAEAGLDVSGSTFTFTGTNIDLDPTGTYNLAMDASQAIQISMADSYASAFVLDDTGGTDWIDIDTSANTIEIGNSAVTSFTNRMNNTTGVWSVRDNSNNIFFQADQANDLITIGPGSPIDVLINGQVDCPNNVDISGGLDVDGGAFTFGGTTFTVAGSGNVLFTMGAGDSFTVDCSGGTSSTFNVDMRDNVALALTIEDGSGNDYMVFSTVTGSEKLTFGNALTDQDFEFAGQGLVDAANGDLDVPSGTNFRIGGTALTTSNWTATAADIVFGDGTQSADAYHTHTAAVGAAQLVEIDVTAGENLAQGDLAGIENSGGNPRAFKADANAAGQRHEAVGIVKAAITSGNAGKLYVAGEVTPANFDVAPVAGDVGKVVYQSTTAGNVTLTAPSTTGDYVKKVGVLTSTTQMVLEKGDSVQL